jgi:hypothetical protein
MNRLASKFQLVTAICLPLFAIELTLSPAAQAIDGEDLYRLCTDFPYNSQCKGYEAPVALEKRSGQVTTCLIKTPQATTKESCKFNLDEEGITLYQEFGTGLSILRDKKATKVIKIPIGSVSGLQYRETEKLDQLSSVLNILAYALNPSENPASDAVDASKKTLRRQFSDISISYGDSPESSPATNQLNMTFERNPGGEIIFRLEKTTGKTAVLLEPKLAK